MNLHKDILKILLGFCFCIFQFINCGDKSIVGDIPGTPSNLTGQALSASSLMLNWVDNSDNETSFLIYRKQGYDWVPLTFIPANSTTFIDSLLQDTTFYSYRVTAKNDNGESSPSNSISISTLAIGLPPSAPREPQPADSSQGVSINPTLSWSCSDPDDDSLRYNLYFGSGGYLNLVDSNLSSSTYQVSQLQYLRQYNWKVVAKDHDQHATPGPVWAFTTRDSISFTLTTLLQGLGNITRQPDSSNYAYGDTVILTAVPGTGWAFQNWIGDTTGVVNPLTIIMHRNMTVTAVFREGTGQATVSGTVSWPGHALTSHTYAFADTIDNFVPYLVGQTTVNPANGSFTITLDNLPAPLHLRFEAQDDVNNSGPWNPIDIGDGWWFYDINNDSIWTDDDVLMVAPGAHLTGVNIILHLWP
jgi:hypothetical protein